MIKITSVRDAINVSKNATNVKRAKYRSGFAGLIAALVFICATPTLAFCRADQRNARQKIGVTLKSQALEIKRLAPTM